MKKYQLQKTDDLYLIKHTDSNEFICTHCDTPYPPLPLDSSELLLEDINNFSLSLNESYIYCCLSTLIELKINNGKFDINKDVLYQIQWDRAYRGMPDPYFNMVEKHFKAKVYEFLEDKMVDLPLNYAESLEELEADKNNCVPETIITAFEELMKSFNQLELFAVILLNNLFQGVNFSMTVFWVANKITDIEFIEAGLVLNGQKEDLKSIKFNVKEKKQIDSYQKRLLSFRIFLGSFRNIEEYIATINI
jgi:hypothetical protein